MVEDGSTDGLEVKWALVIDVVDDKEGNEGGTLVLPAAPAEKSRQFGWAEERRLY
jgi:hypothetical protein